MSQAAAISLQRQSKEAAFPFMLFGSVMAHLLLLTLIVAAPQIFGTGKKEPYGGPSGSGGGPHVIGVVDLGRSGPMAKQKLTQEEPAPSLFVKKKTLDEKPLESKTVLPDEKKKPKEQPANTESLNVPASKRKMEGNYGKGEDKSKDAGKSGSSGTGQFGIGTFGSGKPGEGGYGTGTGVPFPFPWYLENVFTKIELNWSKPYIQETTPQVYTCVVYFVITRAGQVRDLEVEKSSGVPALDRSAESAVLGSTPFPPLPNQWTEPDLPFRLTFSYTR